jgi:hypothetical protein
MHEKILVRGPRVPKYLKNTDVEDTEEAILE